MSTDVQTPFLGTPLVPSSSPAAGGGPSEPRRRHDAAGPGGGGSAEAAAASGLREAVVQQLRPVASAPPLVCGRRFAACRASSLRWAHARPSAIHHGQLRSSGCFGSPCCVRGCGQCPRRDLSRPNFFGAPFHVWKFHPSCTMKSYRGLISAVLLQTSAETSSFRTELKKLARLERRKGVPCRFGLEVKSSQSP